MIERIFNIVIEKENLDKEYLIYCPQIPGSLSQGTSIEDALLNFSEALALYMEVTVKEKLKV